MSELKEKNQKNARRDRQRKKYLKDYVGELYAKIGIDSVPMLEKPDSKSSPDETPKYLATLDRFVNRFLDDYYRMRFERENPTQQNIPSDNSLLRQTSAIQTYGCQPPTLNNAPKWSVSRSSLISCDSGYRPSPTISQLNQSVGDEHSAVNFDFSFIEKISNTPVAKEEEWKIENIKNELEKEYQEQQRQKSCDTVSVSSDAGIHSSTSNLRAQQAACWNENVANKPVLKPKKRKATRSYKSAYQSIATIAGVTTKFFKFHL